MDEKIWLARLSEGWCPRPEHGRLAGDTGCFCWRCCANWSIENGAMLATLGFIFTAGWQHVLILRAEDSALMLATIDHNAREQNRAASEYMILPSEFR